MELVVRLWDSSVLAIGMLEDMMDVERMVGIMLPVQDWG